MSESKHTPYPWFVVEMQPRKHSTANRYLIQSGEANVCTLDVAGREAGRDEANARLIASAPDLLAELENIANAKWANFENAEEFRDWAQSRARFTIAKAKGEQQ
jgi:hypothetical protein